MAVRERVDAVVVGAGVVGLATARSLAARKHEVVVLESAGQIGSGISSRNSEVIHAGIYYAQDSLKARLCVEGKAALYEYCGSHGVPHRRCGKLIVAASQSEAEQLGGIEQNAVANGVDDLEWLTPAEVSAVEPDVSCVSALLSPSTGIVDAHALMLSLSGDVQNAGGHVVTGTKVTGIGRNGGVLTVATDASGDMELEAELVVVAAGLHSQHLVLHIEGFPRESIPPSYLCKGVYFTLVGARPFSRLIYPVPDRHSLGVHATLDMQGSVRFGPDTEWVDGEDYKVDPSRSEGFYSAIRKYYPALAEDSLSPGYAGIRPKTAGPSEAAQDFQIIGPAVHGKPGLVTLFGIESPGLTSCLAIGEYTAELLNA
jgi:L-2-hydroxyglutarate oxidase LhgO